MRHKINRARKGKAGAERRKNPRGNISKVNSITNCKKLASWLDLTTTDNSNLKEG